MKYILSIFGEDTVYESYDKALEAAKEAEYTRAKGFVQIHDTEGNLLYGMRR